MRAFLEDHTRGGLEPDCLLAVDEGPRDLFRRGGEGPLPEVAPFTSLLERLLEKYDAREAMDEENRRVRDAAFREEMLAIFSGKNPISSSMTFCEEKRLGNVQGSTPSRWLLLPSLSGKRRRQQRLPSPYATLIACLAQTT